MAGLRADARRNRERVLAAADAVFTEQGKEASTEEIARRAQVGIGTVFRHFPSKTELLEAVLIARLEHLRDRAAEGSVAEDPGAAFFAYFRASVAEAPAKLAVAELLSATGTDVRAAVHATHLEMRAAFDRLLERAQQSGAVRSEIGADEVYALLLGTSRAAAFSTREATGKALDIVFTGLRA